MAQITWADVDPKAKRVTVYYEGTNTVHEGMLVHYNHDTTTNWSGIDKSAAEGAATYDTDTPEGSQNEGKWIRVEEPSDANRRFPAGVVAKGSDGIGKVGPSSVDIYILNGATVPVYTDRSVTINDPAHMEVGQNTVVNLDLGGEQIGWFMETIDRSSTAGLALVCLMPPDQSSVAASSTLGVGYSPLIWGDCNVEAIKSDPGLGIYYENDFNGTENNVTAEGWVITQTTTGTMSLPAAEGGELLLDTAGSTTADDGLEGQLLGCRFLPKAGTNIWFEARVKVNDATDQWLVGLAATDTSLIAAGVLDDVVDKVGFVHAAADTDNKVSCFTARTSAEDETSDVADVVDGAYATYGFKITGITTVDFYVNGVLVESGAVTANVPNAALCLSLASKIEGTGADMEVSVDWVRAYQDVARA